MDWKTMLRYISGSVDEELRPRIEFFEIRSRCAPQEVDPALIAKARESAAVPSQRPVPSIYSSASPWGGSQPCGAKYPGFCADSKGV